MRTTHPQKENPYLVRHSCQECGEDFWDYLCNSRKFCSRSCAAINKTKRPEIRAVLYSDETKKKIARAHTALQKTEQGAVLREKNSQRMRKKNPMHSPINIEKMKETKRVNGTLNIWKGERGGNGKLTEPQIRLSLALGWPTEVAISMGKRKTGLPTAYKVDLAHVPLKIAIEVDGSSHRSKEGLQKDAKKQAALLGLGWKVLRFTNQEVMTNLFGVLSEIKKELKVL